MKKINPKKLNGKSLSRLYDDQKTLTEKENYEIMNKRDKEQYGYL